MTTHKQDVIEELRKEKFSAEKMSRLKLPMLTNAYWKGKATAFGEALLIVEAMNCV